MHSNIYIYVKVFILGKYEDADKIKIYEPFAADLPVRTLNSC